MTDPLLRILGETFGLPDFRPGQREVIEALARGENVLTVMPTGSGKSLCYQLPAVAADGLTVVVSPLIALMIDQIGSLRSRRIPAGGIYSGMSSGDRSETYRNLEKGGLKILYVSPERFTYENFLGRLQGRKISHFIIDEAHCVSEWGHDFRVEYRALKNVVKALGSPPVGAFTATATQEVRRDIEIQLGIEGAAYFFTGFDRENLNLEVRPAPTKRTKLTTIMELLNEESGSAIVYCSTRKDTEEITEALCDHGFSAVRYHAGLPDAERDTAQKAFLSGKTRIIVATCAFGMGIDKSDIRLVIHFAIPGSVETYYQEIGRAGRDGAAARCVLLWSYPDVQIRRYFIDKSETGEKSPAVRAAEERRLEKMIRYARSYQCRRGFIIDYFVGRHVIFKCGVCDNCGGVNRMQEVPRSEPVLEQAAPEPQGTPESLEWARMVLSCIERIRRAEVSPNLRNVASVLRGQRSDDVKAYGLDALSTWNLFVGWKQREIRGLFRVLREARLIALHEGRIEITEFGRRVMFGKEEAVIPFEREVVTGAVIMEQAEPASGQEFDAEVFERLRAWRSSRAKTDGMPPYVIAHDRTLKSLALAKPDSMEALLEVAGIGPTKAAKFGTEIMGVIHQKDAAN